MPRERSPNRVDHAPARSSARQKRVRYAPQMRRTIIDGWIVVAVTTVVLVATSGGGF